MQQHAGSIEWRYSTTEVSGDHAAAAAWISKHHPTWDVVTIVPITHEEMIKRAINGDVVMDARTLVVYREVLPVYRPRGAPASGQAPVMTVGVASSDRSRDDEAALYDLESENSKLRDRVHELEAALPHAKTRLLDGAIVIRVKELPAVITKSLRAVLTAHGYEIGSLDISKTMGDVIERTDTRERERTLDEIGRNAAQAIWGASVDLGDMAEIRSRVGLAIDMNTEGNPLHHVKISRVIDAVLIP